LRLAAETAGFVLAGGRSSRMGADKALVQLAGRPLISYAVEVLRQAGLDVCIAGARSPLEAFAPVVEDSLADRGPLGGICAALASTAAQWAVFVPVDLPLLPAGLQVSLLERAQITGAAVTACSLNGFTQTFPAVICREALPALRRELEAGRGGCYTAFQAAAGALGLPVEVVPVEFLAQCGQLTDERGLPPALWFLNVNTAEDLCRAECCLGGWHHVS